MRDEAANTSPEIPLETRTVGIDRVTFTPSADALALVGELEEAELTVPYARHGLVAAMHERCTVLSEEHDETGTLIRIRAPARVVASLRDELAQS